MSMTKLANQTLCQKLVANITIQAVIRFHKHTAMYVVHTKYGLSVVSAHSAPFLDIFYQENKF